MRTALALLIVGGFSLCGFLVFQALRRSPASLPVHLPPPGGSHDIGVAMVYLNASTRGRPIAARVWYPRTTGPCERPAPYFPFPETKTSTAFARTQTHGCEEAKAADGHWPVIIYSPGWDGGCFQNTALCEMLSSSGFVVIALNHPGGSPVVKMPDGHTVTNARLERFDLSSEKSSADFFRAADRELDLRTSDVRFVIDSLPLWNSGEFAGGRFRNRLNTDKIGVIGFSFGGAVAAEACRTDPRIRSGVNLDGCFFGKSRRSGSHQPFLILTDNVPPPDREHLESADPAARRTAKFLSEGASDYEYWHDRSEARLIRIEGIEHPDFTDDALLSGPVSSERLGRINTCVTSFFTETLLGEPGSFLDTSATLPWPDFIPASSQSPETR